MATGQSGANRRWTEEDGQPQRLTEDTGVRVEEGKAGSKTGRRCNYWCVAGLLFLIGVVGVVTVLCLYLAGLTGPECNARLQYGVVVDAGSSHSELSLFRWKGEKLKGTGEVIQLTDCEDDVPGISKYGDKDDAEGAGKSLKNCIMEAERKVPDDRHTITPIYLGATAGMRILEQARPDMAEQVFDAVRKVFKDTNFKITENNVRIVKDQEEGLYAWIAANLIKGTLGQTGRKPTTGTLDMGGASTQIAFETSKRAGPPKEEDYEKLRLYGENFEVFTHSYLCFGQNELIRRAKAQVILDDGHARTEYRHPCLHDGHRVTESVDQIFYQTCTIPTPPNLSNLRNDTKIIFVGSGNVDGCKKLVDDILDVTKCQGTPYKYCYDHDFIPETEGEFLAISSFFYTASYLQAIDKPEDEFIRLSEAHCRDPWQTAAEKAKKAKQKEEYVSNFCISGIFITKVIGGIYKLGGDKWKNVKFVKKIDGVSMGWALGFMTNATNSIPTEKVQGQGNGKQMATDLFIALLILFLVLILIVLILSYRAWTHRRGRALGKSGDDIPVLSICCPKVY